jgi:mono/diheme cytochrome c family protein
MTPRRPAALLASALALAAGSAAAASADKVAAGKELAMEACSACHQVAPEQTPPKLVYDPDAKNRVAAPPFAQIARDPRKDGIYIRAILRQPHAPMREQRIDAADADAIVAYILSLRPHGGGKRPAR